MAAFRRRAGADAGHLQGHFQRGGGGCHHPYRTAADMGGQLGFQLTGFGTGGDPAGTQHLADGGDGGFVDVRAGEGQEIHFSLSA